MPNTAISETELMIAVFITVLGVFGLLMLLLSSASKRRAARRAAQLNNRGGKHKKKDASQEALASLRKQEEVDNKGIMRLFGWLPSPDYLHHRLERTGMQLSVRRYLLYNLLLMICIGIVLAKSAGLTPILAGLLGIAAGLIIPHWYTGRRARKREQQFITLFPDAIELIVRGLRSGLPVAESFHSVAEEIEDPVSPVFAEMNERISLGTSMEEAMEDAARRLCITEFDFFVTSLKLQRETGGNLAEILHNLAEAIRGRLMMRLKVKAMASEAKTSAIIVGSLPFLITGAISVTSPEYLIPLFEDIRGNIAVGIGCCSMGIGTFIMMKMTQFEI